MTHNSTLLIAAMTILSVSGCAREERGPVLAGGREVKAWLSDLHHSKPQVRRQAVLKLGNVGDADPAVAAGLVDALGDPDVVVRRDAVRAIAKFPKPTEAMVSRLQEMKRSDRDSLVRDYAERAIAHLEKAE